MKIKKIYLKSFSYFEEEFSKYFSRKMIVGLLMLFSGSMLLYVVGFAQGPGNFIHNAAHDTRHASGFPCH